MLQAKENILFDQSIVLLRGEPGLELPSSCLLSQARGAAGVGSGDLHGMVEADPLVAACPCPGFVFVLQLSLHGHLLLARAWHEGRCHPGCLRAVSLGLSLLNQHKIRG